MSHPLASMAGAALTPFAGIPMLAQLEAPKSAEFGAWMLSLACFVVIMRQLMALGREWKESVKEKPAPAETYQLKTAAEASAAAQKTQCAATHAALEKLLDERNEALRETKTEIKGLAQRIDQVLAMVLRRGGKRDE